MKAVHVFNRLLLVLAILLALSGCGSEVKDAPYPVIDTGYWSAQVNSLAEPSWLDNERILFTSTESLAPGKPPYRVKILNTATGQLVSTNLGSFICVRNGQVFYGVRDKTTDKVTYYRGSLENATERPAPGPDMHIDRVFDCDWVPKGLPLDRVPYRSKLFGENYLEILEIRRKPFEYQKRPRRRLEQWAEDLGPEGKIVYHRDESDSGRLLPSGGISYSEYLDAYVVGHPYYDPQWLETRSFWILQRNGELKEVPYPETMPVGRNDVYPVKPGYVVHYRGGPLTEKENSRGLYLIEGGNVSRLIVGSVHGIHISPDGCKVAFVHARNFEEDISVEKPHRTVKYIYFCQGGSTS